MLDLTNKKILVTGGAGFLGQHLINELKTQGASHISTPTLQEINLLSPEDCRRAVTNQNIVIHTAGKVGGIGANRSEPGAFFYENTLMGIQLLEAARLASVEKFVQIGSVCSYPKEIASFPYREEDLWSGYPEETNGPYGLAKKSLLVQGQAYRQQYSMNIVHLLLVNMYGPNDHFGSPDSHVIPALIDRFWQATQENLPEVVCWGTGSPTRDFLYVKDAAKGIVLATLHYDGANPINLGSGQEISIQNLSETIAKLVGYQGKISWNTSKPDGHLRRLFDVSKAKEKFHFTATTSFQDGLAETINWYKQNITTKQTHTS